jgi:hypothetical protein
MKGAAAACPMRCSSDPTFAPRRPRDDRDG